MSAPRLERPGIVLRALELGDADALFAAHGDERTHHYWSSPAHKSVEETATYIQGTLDIAGAHAWAITTDGGQALGRIGLFVEREGVGEIGIILRPDAAGRGFASKALNLVVAYGFETLDLHRIAADIDPDNTASLNLFLRNGFEREGLLRGNWKTHIGIRDTVMLAKLRG
ncbi:GNAT family N-acetyltransferase [Vitreimonas flagellata]|uniref:GNAT family N-acetyltransferase n=1 Tax=Vitreimonas flagellata TaxID=2560861 RepID=UPI001075632F|nr:GNAT family N-acetyltransferase [Vitreimonas flagellata]